MIKYQITKSTVTVEETKTTSYGIACTDNDKEIARIDDISICEEEVKKTVQLFNENELSPEHFKDAVEDSII